MLSNHIFRRRDGFTLFEVIVTAAILGILAAIIFSQTAAFRRQAVLNLESERLLAIINQTRGETLHSVLGRSYGLRFSATEVAVFAGAVYNPEQVTATYYLDPQVRLSGIGLSHGQPEVSFARLTGLPSATGTLTISLTANSSQNRLVIIEPSGIIRVD